MSYSTTIHDQVANLYIQAQDGDAKGLEDLMRMHEGLVHYIVRQQWRGRLSYEQAIHVGRIGLWRAVLGFDPGRGYAFSTYAGVVIARHVWRAVRRAEKKEQVVRLQIPSSWYVELREPNTNELIQGTTRLTVGYPIFFHDDPRLPPGQIFVFTGAQPPEPMRLRDLDTIAFIWYQSPLDYQPPSDPPTYLLGVS